MPSSVSASGYGEGRPLAKTEVRFLLQDLQGQFEGVKKAGKRLRAFEVAWARLQNEKPGWPEDTVHQAFQTALLDWLRYRAAVDRSPRRAGEAQHQMLCDVPWRSCRGELSSGSACGSW